MSQGKHHAWIIAILAAMMLGLLGGCASSNAPDAGSASAQGSEPAFEGDFVISADEALSKMGSESVIMVDCTGNASLGTVKGAIALSWQDLSTCSAEYGEAGDEGWGKIPDPEEFASILGSYGLDKDKEVICLGHTSSGWGEDGRVAWMLRAAGYQDVKIVDGGIDALKDAGAETQMGGSTPVPCKVEVDSIDKTHVVETDELLANFDAYTFVDTRAIEEYEGATFYGEKKGGRIPGAIHIDYLDLFREDGTLKSNDAIAAMFESAGVSKTDKIATYCTGGIRSAYMQLVLEMCGFEDTANYDQSYWRWCVVGDVEEASTQQAA